MSNLAILSLRSLKGVSFYLFHSEQTSYCLYCKAFIGTLTEFIFFFFFRSDQIMFTFPNTVNSINLQMSLFAQSNANSTVCQAIKDLLLPNGYDGPVSWGCRTHWLYFCREVRLPQWVSYYETKPSDGEAPKVLELWEMQSTPLSSSLLGPLWLGVVTPDRGLSMRHIELICLTELFDCFCFMAYQHFLGYLMPKPFS